ncbi:MAG: CRISPR-associated protein Cas5t [Bacillota bacterium]|jgi:CRISPR-associated Cas5-like protein|nr:CRISPR-associated protein Cas5t [Bacillota bacterium]MDN5364945.1 CRISPR-associated protein Cas5t [Thermacetogenium sp.]
MNVLWVKVAAPVASFRRPLDHNYQRTLLLPPPTTLLGLAGAALGLSEGELWHKGPPLQGLLVAALALQKPGGARDMWTVMKIKNNKITERSPYFRELLFFARYMLLYGGPTDLLEALQAAFTDPVYPLSLGREDELIILEDMGLERAVAGEARFFGTVIPGDLRQLDFRWLPRPGIIFEPPVVEVLPLGFELDQRGMRHPVGATPFTFLPFDLEVEVPGQKEVFTLEALEGRSFTWMNSPSLANRIPLSWST